MSCEDSFLLRSWPAESFDLAYMNECQRKTSSSLQKPPAGSTQPLNPSNQLSPASNLQALHKQHLFPQVVDSSVQAAQHLPTSLTCQSSHSQLALTDAHDKMHPATPRGFPQMFSSSYLAEQQQQQPQEPHFMFQYQQPTLDFPIDNNPQFYSYSALPDDMIIHRSYDNAQQAYGNGFSRGPSFSPQAGHLEAPTSMVATARSSPSYPATPLIDEVEEASKDEPYAVLIYKALIDAPRHRMVLKDIYEWFEKNTDKTKSSSKGWQNSIRHNLSMNQGFRKEDMSPGDDGKKGYIWVLEPAAILAGGVQSTTRFRKSGGPGPGRRGTGNAYHRNNLATQRYGGIRKTAGRYSSRYKPTPTSNPDMYQPALFHPEPTPEPEDIQMKIEAHIDDVPSISTMQNPFANFDMATQYRQPQLQQQRQQYFPLPVDFNNAAHYQPYTPPSTVDSLAPTSPYVHYGSGVSSEDEDEQDRSRVTWLDKPECEPGQHALDCYGPTCHC